MSHNISEILLTSKALHINTEDYFTWSSGLKSPIYCDNRILISHPAYRDFIVDMMCEKIKSLVPKGPNSISGTATAGIPWAAWVADKLNLPLLYVRGESKKHGLQNSIEGDYSSLKKTFIIEDLVSTGKSVFNAYENLNDVGINPLGVLSIFTYNLEISKELFEKSNIVYTSLDTIDTLLNFASAQSMITEEQLTTVLKWRDELNRRNSST